jgi:aarF domain-containing kinase
MAAVAIESEEQLNAAERLSRAASFYSTAVPVFAAYRALAEKYDFQRNVLGEEVSEEEEEAEYQKLHDWGSEALMQKITELKGFYIKTGQIISTRVDIFPEQYTSKLSVCQDAMESVPGEVIKDIVRKELLGGAPLSELFSEFDDEPLGSASIAQVHKARLLDGRVVAVKVQRPGIGPKLLGDIANLINFAKVVTKYLPVDYVKVFVEVQKSLRYELDFLFEAQTTLKVASAVAHCPRNKPQKAAVRVPLPIPGLVSTKVLVMEFIDGVALSQVGEKMKERGIEEGSLESKIFGRKLLSSLTNAYGSMIFGSGIIHADPHP